MIIHCSQCGKSVSTEVPEGIRIKAWIECPECIEKSPDKNQHIYVLEKMQDITYRALKIATMENVVLLTKKDEIEYAKTKMDNYMLQACKKLQTAKESKQKMDVGRSGKNEKIFKSR